MNRLLSIVVTLFVLFLFYIWINHLTSEKNPGATLAAAETPRSGADSESTVSVLRGGEEESESIPSSVQENAEQPGDRQDASVVRQEIAKAADNKGSHLVIAGNFLDRTNASKMVEKLRKLGYQESEIVRFELSEYYTVCAGRYTTDTEARRMAKSIEDKHSIDTYVRIAD